MATITRAFPNSAVTFLVYEWIVLHSSKFMPDRLRPDGENEGVGAEA